MPSNGFTVLGVMLPVITLILVGGSLFRMAWVGRRPGSRVLLAFGLSLVGSINLFTELTMPVWVQYVTFSCGLAGAVLTVIYYVERGNGGVNETNHHSNS